MKRYCSVCGAELGENDVFCWSCGAVQRENDGIHCVYCGAELEPGGEYCPVCGRKVVSGAAESQPENISVEINGGSGTDRKFYGGPEKRQDKKGPNMGVIIAAVCSVVAAVGVAACLFIVYGPAGGEKADKETEMAAVTENVTPMPAASTETGSVQYDSRVPVYSLAPVVPPQRPTVPPSTDSRPDSSYSKSYRTYQDSEYSFSCPYPSDFILTNTDSDFYQRTLTAPDGSGVVCICAARNSSGRTPEQVRDDFMAAYEGTSDYNNSGDTWCVASTFDGTLWHYGYFSLKNGMIRGFEVHYYDAYEDRYERYINDIYDGLKLN